MSLAKFGTAFEEKLFSPKKGDAPRGRLSPRKSLKMGKNLTPSSPHKPQFESIEKKKREDQTKFIIEQLKKEEEILRQQVEARKANNLENYTVQKTEIKETVNSKLSRLKQVCTHVMHQKTFLIERLNEYEMRDELNHLVIEYWQKIQAERPIITQQQLLKISKENQKKLVQENLQNAQTGISDDDFIKAYQTITALEKENDLEEVKQQVTDFISPMLQKQQQIWDQAHENSKLTFQQTRQSILEANKQRLLEESSKKFMDNHTKKQELLGQSKNVVDMRKEDIEDLLATKVISYETDIGIADAEMEELRKKIEAIEKGIVDDEQQHDLEKEKMEKETVAMQQRKEEQDAKVVEAKKNLELQHQKVDEFKNNRGAYEKEMQEKTEQQTKELSEKKVSLEAEMTNLRNSQKELDMKVESSKQVLESEKPRLQSLQKEVEGIEKQLAEKNAEKSQILERKQKEAQEKEEKERLEREEKEREEKERLAQEAGVANPESSEQAPPVSTGEDIAPSTSSESQPQSEASTAPVATEEVVASSSSSSSQPTEVLPASQPTLEVTAPAASEEIPPQEQPITESIAVVKQPQDINIQQPAAPVTQESPQPQSPVVVSEQPSAPVVVTAAPEQPALDVVVSQSPSVADVVAQSPAVVIQSQEQQSPAVVASAAQEQPQQSPTIVVPAIQEQPQQQPAEAVAAEVPKEAQSPVVVVASVQEQPKVEAIEPILVPAPIVVPSTPKSADNKLKSPISESKASSSSDQKPKTPTAQEAPKQAEPVPAKAEPAKKEDPKDPKSKLKIAVDDKKATPEKLKTPSAKVEKAKPEPKGKGKPDPKAKGKAVNPEQLREERIEQQEARQQAIEHQLEQIAEINKPLSETELMLAINNTRDTFIGELASDEEDVDSIISARGDNKMKESQPVDYAKFYMNEKPEGFEKFSTDHIVESIERELARAESPKEAYDGW